MRIPLSTESTTASITTNEMGPTATDNSDVISAESPPANVFDVQDGRSVVEGEV